jgi:sucrose-phosphate synthase
MEPMTNKRGLYVVLISIHGLIRGNELELGRDADTGGQTKYVVELSRALGNHPDIEKVELLTRQIIDDRVDGDYAETNEKLSEHAQIVRLQCGPKRYIRKENLWPHLDVYIDNAIKYFRRQRRVPDIIHAHYADAGYVGAHLSNMMGVPLVFTGHSLGREKKRLLMAHGMDENTVEKKYEISRRTEAEEVALDNALMVIASTHQEIKRQYSSYENYRIKQMHVIPPGVDLDRFHPSKRRGRYPAIFNVLKRFLSEPTKPCILAISRADERKNIQTLVHAYGKSKKLQELANLIIIAGNRDDIRQMERGARKVLQELLINIDKYDLYGKVCYPKHHDPDNIPEFYRLAARLQGVFINPAMTEPFGLTLIEAAASGLPIVATNDGGPRDIIASCHNGSLIDPLDEQDITQALLRVLDDPEQWRRYATNGIKGVKKHYSWDSHVRKYLSTLKKRLRLRRVNRFFEAKRSQIPTAKKFLIADIDNTLLGDVEAAQRLIKVLDAHRGELGFAVATGRRIESARAVLKEWNMPEPEVFISSVGTEIHYKGTNLPLDESWAKHISDQWEPDKIRELITPLPGIVNQEKAAQRSYKISYFYDPKKSPNAGELRRILRQNNLHAKVIMSHGQFLDIIPIRASKGHAVRFLAMRWGIEPEDIIVAGDSGNDEEMLNGNTLGVVVGNYSKELTKLRGKHAIYFAEKTYADGILEGMEHYGFLKQLEHTS